jgi:hypothetical protein
MAKVPKAEEPKAQGDEGKAKVLPKTGCLKSFFKPAESVGARVSGVGTGASGRGASGASSSGKRGASGASVRDWWDDTPSEVDAEPAKKKQRRLSPLAKRQARTIQSVVDELHLERMETSGHQFNCLAFSVSMATQQIGPSLQEQHLSCNRNHAQEERRLTHVEVFKQLPPEAETASDQTWGHDKWWCGYNKAKLQLIFDNNLFMGEAHVHGFANRLDRQIIVIDERERQVTLSEYTPGYESASKLINLRTAKEYRGRVDQPLWLLQSPGHWSALSTLKEDDDSTDSNQIMRCGAHKGKRPRKVVLMSDSGGSSPLVFSD